MGKVSEVRSEEFTVNFELAGRPIPSPLKHELISYLIGTILVSHQAQSYRHAGSLGPCFIYLHCHSYVSCRGSFIPVVLSYCIHILDPTTVHSYYLAQAQSYRQICWMFCAVVPLFQLNRLLL